MTRTILIVSDDPAISEDLAYSFPDDVTVETFDDARASALWMADNTPSLVIVDLQIGSSGGFSLAREMSQHTHLMDVPVLMLLERDQDQWLAKQAGARSTAVKPVAAGELVDGALALLS